ncbi:hypothetical protein ANN_22521 [Periplaneta americana]|uniref:Uncharacterized protein n=1 Tax=Periplaneta americana TaxID=6978 RepID=A0ABQ8S8M2_PERAM|nr:hypothetical protein ANN_22521 [Periplaneta americana]
MAGLCEGGNESPGSLKVISTASFIVDEHGNRINVNANVYRQVIERFQGDLITFCELNNLDLGQQVFQQDGATAHTGRGNLTLLQELFPGRVISRGSDFPYPARSPDLSL